MRNNLNYLYFISILSTWINLSVSTTCSLDTRNEYGPSQSYNYYGPMQRQIISTSVTYTCKNVTLPLSKDSQWNRDWKKTVVIENSNLTVVKSADFLQIDDVLYLHLSVNNIKTIQAGAFTGLSKLRQLFLDHNELVELPQGLFNSLLDMSTLDVSYNNIQQISPNFLTGLQNLNYLNLSHNSIYEFNAEFLGQNYKFFEINLSDNHLDELVLNNSVISISKLDVSKNNLTIINVCSKSLNELNISFNRIRHLLTNSVKCNHLTKLDISFNSLTETNINNISTLNSLKYLNLAGNNVTFISTSLFLNLTRLTYLDMSYNKLKTLSYGIFDHMYLLDYLDISNNNLTSLKRYLHSLSKLKTLLVNKNNIRSIDSKQMLLDMPNLESIDLDENNLACNELVEIVHVLKDKIKRGDGRVGSNIHGISCDEYEFDLNDDESKIKGIVSYLENAISSKLDKTEGHEFERSFMYNYFNKDFKNSNFYKYLEGLQNVNLGSLNESQLIKYFNDDFSNSQFYKFLESLRACENSTFEFNRSIYNYFNADFKSSSFVKYLNQLEKSKNDFEKTSMFNFFNESFKDTTFYRVMEKFNTQQQSEHLHKSPETSTNYFVLLPVIVLLLTVSVAIQIINLYRNFNKHAIFGREQVELIRSTESV